MPNLQPVISSLHFLNVITCVKWEHICPCNLCPFIKDTVCCPWPEICSFSWLKSLCILADWICSGCLCVVANMIRFSGRLSLVCVLCMNQRMYACIITSAFACFENGFTDESFEKWIHKWNGETKKHNHSFETYF